MDNMPHHCDMSAIYQKKFPHVNNVCKMIGYHCSYLQVWINLKRRCEGISVTSGCWFTAGIYLTFTPNPTSLKGKRKLFSRPILMGWPFWVDIRVLCKPYPLFQWYPQCKEISLNLSMKCWNSAFSAQCSRLIILLVQLGAETKYVAAVKALKKKERQD
jgi:hypothetical protein